MKKTILLLLLSVTSTFLWAQNAYIQVTGESGLSVFLNGRFKAKTTAEYNGCIIENVSPGKNTIKIVKDGYAPYEEVITISPGEVFAYKVKPFAKHIVTISEQGNKGETGKKVELETGKLLVQSVPINIKISMPAIEGVSDIPKTKDEWIADKIPAGNYTIQFSFNQKMIEKKLVIKKNEKTKVFVNLLSGEYKETYMSQSVVMEYVSIPAGTFIMGSAAAEDNMRSDELQHYVTLDAFKMSKYEVSFEQYDMFCELTGRPMVSDNGWGRGKMPVINVSWDDAAAFAAYVGARLPTEAEWEYACRAGTTTRYNTGNTLSTSQANYDGSYPYRNNPIGLNRQKTLTVGSFEPNAWGLYDMHGNVAEWCSDWYELYSASPQRNPRGAAFGTTRVYKGGSYLGIAGICRSAKRFSTKPDYRMNSTGFRVVTK